MTQKYENSTISAIAVLDQSSREKLTSSLWPKLAMKNGKTSVPSIITDKERFALMQGETYKPQTEAYQEKLSSTGKTAAVKDWKSRNLPGSLPGEYNGKGEGFLQSYCPKVVGDIDGLCDENEVAFLLEDLKSIPIVYAAYASPSYKGIRFEVLTGSTAATHKQYETAVLNSMAAALNLPVKKAGETVSGAHIDKDNNRKNPSPWFLGHVPEELFFVNWESDVYHDPTIKETVTRKEENRKEPRRQKNTITENFDLETNRAICQYLIGEIERRSHDITQGMSFNGAWFALASAFITEFGEQEGGAFFHRVSQFYQGYTEKETEQTVKAAAKKGTTGNIGFFYKLCGEYGYQFKDFLADYWKEQREEENRREQPAKVKPSSGSGAKGEQEKQVVRIIPPVLVEAKELPAPTIDGLSIKDGRYFIEGAKQSQQPVSNFLITPLYLLRDSREPKRVMQCENVNGETTVICCSVKAMTSNSEFAAIVEGRGNFVPSWTSSQLSTIKEYLFEHEDRAEEITVLGHQPDTNYYAFANGIFDGQDFYQVNEYGIAKIGEKQFYLPAFSKVNEDAEKEYHNERKFVFQHGETDFSNWSRSLTSVFGDNGKIGICFLVASIFRDVVFSYANSFPILFLFGPKGTGKTTFRNALHRLFGDYGPNDAIGLESASSPKGFARKLAQQRNGLQAFEEYKNKINPNLIGMLKNVYDGIGYERAQTSNDNKTHATLVNSAVIVGGQEMPTKENALFSRVLMLTFGKTKFSENDKANYRKLEEIISEGLGSVLTEIVRHRETVKESFALEFSKIYGHLRKDPETSNLEERSLTNIAAILTPFKILSDHLDFPFDYKDIYQTIRERIKAQDRYMTKTNEVNQFWQILDSLEGIKITEGDYYAFKDDVLYIYLSGIYQMYSESAFKQGVTALPKSTLEEYLKLQPYYESRKGNGNRISLKKGGLVSKQYHCITFNTTMMENLELDFLNKKNRNTV